MKGRVIFGAHRVASFRATRRGRFLVKFVVPGSHSGQVRLVAEQVVRGRHGSLRRLRWAKVRFRIVARGSSVVPAGGPGAGSGSSPGGPPGASPGGSTGGWWVPPQHLTWYWQLQGTINNGEPVSAYDIDGFDNSASEVAALHGQGKHVVCYVDVGTYEPGRPDSGKFPASAEGADVEGWPGEKWLDVRQLGVLEPIMTARLRMCREKGFDAVEPDNMDGYENGTGFPITAQQQLAYDEWVAGEAHALGMAVFQKNDGGRRRSLCRTSMGPLTSSATSTRSVRASSSIWRRVSRC